jgi:hypothetical protein
MSFEPPPAEPRGPARLTYDEPSAFAEWLRAVFEPGSTSRWLIGIAFFVVGGFAGNIGCTYLLTGKIALALGLMGWAMTLVSSGLGALLFAGLAASLSARPEARVATEDLARADAIRQSRLARESGGSPSGVYRSQPVAGGMGDAVAGLHAAVMPRKMPFFIAAAVGAVIGVVGVVLNKQHASVDRAIEGALNGGEPRARVSQSLKELGYTVALEDIQVLGLQDSTDHGVTTFFVTVRSPALHHQAEILVRTDIARAVPYVQGRKKDRWPMSGLGVAGRWAAIVLGFGAALVLGWLAFRAES